MADEKKTKTLSLGGGKLSLGASPSQASPSPVAPSVDSPPLRSGLRSRSASNRSVEVVRKRPPGIKPAPSRKPVVEEAAPTPSTPPPPVARPPLDNLTDRERAARNRALQVGLQQKPLPPAPIRTAAATESVVDTSESAADAADNSPIPRTIEERRQQELAEMQQINAEEEKRRSDANRRHAPTQARQTAAATPDASTPIAPAAIDDGPSSSRNLGRRRETPEQPKKPQVRRLSENQRRGGGKITITKALDGGETMRQRSLASVRRAREREKARMRMGDQVKIKQVRDVIIPEAITVQELANRMAERAADVIKELMKLNIMATVTQTIDGETAELVVTELGHKPTRVSEADVDIVQSDVADDPATLKPRPPVVTVVGHVDHGKTSLLDAIRASDVAAGESGGITQHIGAYQVMTPMGNLITFIDTPGHEAFTSMRMRGVNITDIVVLVVAADDGVMPQTIEAINHARAANCPIIIAVNKCDKPDADPQKVRHALLSQEIVTEDFGGDVLCVDVSAHTKMGLDKLEEAILLQAEILELKANPDRAAEGAVIEAKVERGRGSVASLLVTRGTMKIGDIFVVGAETGRVRGLFNDKGEAVKKAVPGDAVEVLGLNGTPMAGDFLTVVDSDARAREVSEYRREVMRQKELTVGKRGSVEQMLSAIAAGESEELPVVIKTDVHGSLEAIKVAIENLGTDQVKVRILSSGVGAISESDISLAVASQGLIIAFNVRANQQARDQARRDGIEIRYYSVIYELIDEIKSAMSGLLSPETKENFIGYAEILEVFNITKTGKIAGCKITEGTIKRGCNVRLLRDNIVIHEGMLKTLKRFKEEVKEVFEGQECGMAFENYGDLLVGDVIECFEIQEIARSLD